MSTANELADNLASVSINDSTNGASPAAAAQTDATAASADEGRRLYIGNLAYATTEGELKDFFSAYTMLVLSVSLFQFSIYFILHFYLFQNMCAVLRLQISVGFDNKFNNNSMEPMLLLLGII